jgi:hypothetical protein
MCWRLRDRESVVNKPLFEVLCFVLLLGMAEASQYNPAVDYQTAVCSEYEVRKLRLELQQLHVPAHLIGVDVMRGTPLPMCRATIHRVVAMHPRIDLIFDVKVRRRTHQDSHA